MTTITSPKTNLNLVSSQWASRPNDERFLSVADLTDFVRTRRSHTGERTLPIRELVDKLAVTDNVKGEFYIGDSRLQLTNYAFGQLASRVKAPAGYLRTLPPLLAMNNLQWGLAHPPAEYDQDTKVLVRVPFTTADRSIPGQVASFTSSTYGRIYDIDVAEKVEQFVTANPNWQVPAQMLGRIFGEDYAPENANWEVTKSSTTLYASDRDVFMFLVDPREIMIPGDPSPKFRGFIVWNSEVGKCVMGVMAFLLEGVCCNRILWGVSDINKVLIRHTSGGPDRFREEVAPALKAYGEGSVGTLVEGIVKAKTFELADTKADALKFLVERGFTQTMAKLGMERAEQYGDGNPLSAWNIVEGITDAARSITYQDDRFAIEMQAGKLLDLVK